MGMFRPAGCHRDGGIRVTSGVLLRHRHVQHGRTLHRKELKQGQVRGGMSPTGDLRRLQPQERQQRMRLVPPQTTVL